MNWTWFVIALMVYALWLTHEIRKDFWEAEDVLGDKENDDDSS